MTRILIVEDEDKISRFLELELRHEGYEVGKADNGRTGLDMALSGVYDLLVLDIMLPELNGLEVLRRIRKSSQLPIIMLTARDAVMDKVSGLDMGANDYITKPFAIEELLARIRVMLRSAAPAPQGNLLQCGALCMNPDSHTVSYATQEISLTAKEFALLQALLKNQDIVLSRDVLLDSIWGYGYIGETNVVDVYIRYLRQKIDDVYGFKLIHTVRGVGYVIKSEKEAQTL